MILRLNAELKVHLFFIFVLDQNFFVSGHQAQSRSIFISTIFLFLFFRLQEHTNPTILMDARQWVKIPLLFLLSGLAFLVTLLPFSNLITAITVIVIMPYFYLLMCYKPIRDIFQLPWAYFNNLVAHHLSFKTVRDSVQLPWVFFNSFFTHFLCLQISGTCPSAYGSLRTASLHISSILKWSGTYFRASGSSSTAFSHISCVLT